MKVVYGIHGYGRGHASRALPIIRELLQRGHEVIAVAGGQAYEFIRDDVRTMKVDCFTFEQVEGTKTDPVKTVRVNLPKYIKLLLRVQDYQAVKHLCTQFRPDAIITDSEPFTAWVGKDLGIPVMCLDHYGIIANAGTRIPMSDTIRVALDKWAYRKLIPKPSTRVISSFYSEPSDHPIVGPIIRKELVEAYAPVTTGSHYVAYFSSGIDHSQLEELKALNGLVVVFHNGPAKRDENIQWVPRNRALFDLAISTCRGVICSAGNQIISESVFLGKPLYVIPEDSVEQRLNASYILRMGVGLSAEEIDNRLLSVFESNLKQWAQNTKRHRWNGLPDAVKLVEDWLATLA